MNKKYSALATKLFKEVIKHQKRKKDRFFMNAILENTIELGVTIFHGNSNKKNEDINYAKVVMELMLKNGLPVSDIKGSRNFKSITEKECDVLVIKVLELMCKVFNESDSENEYTNVFEPVENVFFELIYELLFFKEEDAMLQDSFILLVFDYLEGRRTLGNTIEIFYAMKEAYRENINTMSA